METKSSQAWHTVLKDLRKEAGLSEREAAVRAMIARSTLRKLEKPGSEISISKLEALLGIYGYELEAVRAF